MIKKLINSIAIDKKDHVLLGIIIGFPLVLFFGLPCVNKKYNARRKNFPRIILR